MAADRRILFAAERVFNGCEAAAPATAVLVKGERIEAIAPLAHFAGFDGPTLHLSGATLMPGLIDCHVHLCFGSEPDIPGVLHGLSDAQLALKAAHNARTTLSAGVTSVRDLGGVRGSDLALRDALRRGSLLGPHLSCSGRFICMTGGHGCWAGLQADGTQEVVKAVREVVASGADWVKIIATGGVLTRNTDPMKTLFREDELDSSIAEAKRLGRRVAVHAHGAHAVARSVNAGADSIEHGFQLTGDVIAGMLARDVFLVPTFSAVAAILEHAGRLSAEMVDKAGRYTETHVASFRAFASAGGSIAMGTDAGTPFNHHGDNTRELQLMVSHGLTPVAALRAATSEAARLLGLSERGSIAPGRIADMLIVSGDPMTDIAHVADRRHHIACVSEGCLIGGAMRHQLSTNAAAMATLIDMGAIADLRMR